MKSGGKNAVIFQKHVLLKIYDYLCFQVLIHCDDSPAVASEMLSFNNWRSGVIVMLCAQNFNLICRLVFILCHARMLRSSRCTSTLFFLPLFCAETDFIGSRNINPYPGMQDICTLHAHGLLVIYGEVPIPSCIPSTLVDC